jgi:FtsP/CotA-like multicopper oxidase with cupredoxin domain
VWRTSVPRPDYTELEHKLTGASRLDLAVRCAGDASIYYSEGDITNLDPVVAITAVSGDPTIASPYKNENTLDRWVPPRPLYLADYGAYKGNVVEFDVLAGRNSDRENSINGVVFDVDVSLEDFDYETVQEWTLKSSRHPLHVHVNHMQVFKNSCGERYEVGEFYDTIRAETDMECVVRFKFVDYSKRVILHCHNLRHEDAGMMAWVDVKGGPDDDVETVESVTCDSLVTPKSKKGSKSSKKGNLIPLRK